MDSISVLQSHHLVMLLREFYNTVILSEEQCVEFLRENLHAENLRLFFLLHSRFKRLATPALKAAFEWLCSTLICATISL